MTSMTVETGAPAGEISAPVVDSGELSMSDARMLIEQMDDPFNEKPAKAEKIPPAERAEPATAEPKSSKEDSAPETDPAEASEANEPAEEPPIDPPRSWTQAEKERFQSLPRETQEYLSHREQERETALRRSQNELAEQRKAINAEREAAEKARQQYEAQLPSLLKELESVHQAQFGDIKTMDDVVKLQAEDPFRFQAWQVHQMRLQAAKQEAEKAEGQKAQAKQNERAQYEASQNKILVELVPEMADPKKASELRERAVKMLTDDLGLTNDQLSQWMQDDTGHQILSNASIQKLIADGLKYRDILNAPKAVAAKDIPPVVRPGVARPAGAADAENIQALERKLSQTGSEKDAWALYEARLKAGTRRAS